MGFDYGRTAARPADKAGEFGPNRPLQDSYRGVATPHRGGPLGVGALDEHSVHMIVWRCAL